MANVRLSTEKLEALERAFVVAHAIPVMDLVHQFLNPGKVAAPLDEKELKPKPLFTRQEAFSRLYERLSTINLVDQVAFEHFIEQLKLKKSPSSFEQVILGLAYWHGCGTLEDKDAAFLQFELASADENNGYADALLGFAYAFLGKKGRLKLFQRPDMAKALECLEKAKKKSPETEGYVVGVKGDIHLGKNETKLALADYKKSADLGGFIGLQGYSYLSNDIAEQNKYLEANIAIASLSNYAFSVLYPNAASRPIAVKWFELAAKYGSYGGVYNAAICFEYGNGVPKDAIRAAKYYRCALHLPHLNRRYEAINYSLDMLLKKNKGSVTIVYHCAMAFDKASQLSDLFNKHPETFMQLWLEDYRAPLHPGMKAQAIKAAFNNATILNCLLDKNPDIFNSLWTRDYDRYLFLDIKAAAIKYASTLNLEKLSAATCQVLATAFSNCSEKSIKDKARAFSLAAVEKAKKEKAVADEKLTKERDARSGVAVYTIAAIAGAHAAASSHSINGVQTVPSLTARK